jgi:hypothetical protein
MLLLSTNFANLDLLRLRIIPEGLEAMLLPKRAAHSILLPPLTPNIVAT